MSAVRGIYVISLNGPLSSVGGPVVWSEVKYPRNCSEQEERCSEQGEMLRARRERKRETPKPRRSRPSLQEFFLLCRHGVAGRFAETIPAYHRCTPAPAWFQAKGTGQNRGKEGRAEQLEGGAKKTSMCHFHRSTSVGGQGPGNGYLGSFLLTAT